MGKWSSASRNPDSHYGKGCNFQVCLSHIPQHARCKVHNLFAPHLAVCSLDQSSRDSCNPLTTHRVNDKYGPRFKDAVHCQLQVIPDEFLFTQSTSTLCSLSALIQQTLRSQNVSNLKTMKGGPRGSQESLSDLGQCLQRHLLVAWCNKGKEHMKRRFFNRLTYNKKYFERCQM